MQSFRALLNLLVFVPLSAATWAILSPSLTGAAWAQTPPAATAQSKRLDQLFEQLKEPGADWSSTEREIWREWSKSGSAAMDLLLQRGQAAMRAGDLPAAIGHFSALIDHAPEFAEGWNARATAFYAIGEFGPSLSDIRMTLALNPRHFGALAGLGMILEEVAPPQEALRAYRAARAIHPHLPGVLSAIDRLERTVEGQKI